MIARARSYIFRCPSRCRRPRVCLNSPLSEKNCSCQADRKKEVSSLAQKHILNKHTCYRPFSIVLVKLAFNATRNSRKKPKKCKIMPDFFKKCHFNSKNPFVLFQTKLTNSYIICSYQQQVILNNFLFIKLGVRIKTFPANSH